MPQPRMGKAGQEASAADGPDADEHEVHRHVGEDVGLEVALVLQPFERTRPQLALVIRLSAPVCCSGRKFCSVIVITSTPASAVQWRRGRDFRPAGE